MVEAVQLSFAFLPVIDYLTAVWPCHSAFSLFALVAVFSSKTIESLTDIS